MENILVVDDEVDILTIFSEQLSKWGYHPIVAQNGDEGIKKFKEHPIDLTISDIKMPTVDGMTFLHRLKRHDENAIVIMVTGYPSIDSAVSSIKEGAYDYLVKPINIDDLKLKIERGLEKKKLVRSVNLWKGLNWSLIISIPIWLVLGYLLARSI
jgi:DNA-binding NtrC family response regulator